MRWDGGEDGQTPVDPDDAQYLTTDYSWIRTRDELNDAEATNIAEALLWLEEQQLAPDDLLHQMFLREVHRQMFSDVWTWAWGARSGLAAVEARRLYLDALRTADRGDYTDLLANAVS